VADLPSRQDLFAAGRLYIKQQGLITPSLRITPAIADVPGSDVNIVLGTSSLMGEQLTAAWVKCMKQLFIQTATGAGLDRKVYDNFGNQMARKPANAATVDTTLRRPTFGAGGGTVNAGARFQTPSGSIFSLQTDVTFGATDLVQPGEGFAAIVGPTQNVPANTLTSWLDQPFDPSITITNPTPAAGGTSAESDAQLRGRALVFFLSIRRGILAAIQFGATNGDSINPGNPLPNPINGVSIATAYEIVNPGNALPAGAVQLIIGDDNGNASAAMIQSVKDAQLGYRCAGIPVFVSGGQVVFEQVIYQLDFASGINTQKAAAQVAAVAVAITQFNQPGQPLLRSDLLAAARAVPGVIVTDQSLVAPVGDVIPTSNQTILRVRLQDVSFQ
jgi:uncharacterized phage protein gp47/JayE